MAYWVMHDRELEKRIVEIRNRMRSITRSNNISKQDVIRFLIDEKKNQLEQRVKKNSKMAGRM